MFVHIMIDVVLFHQLTTTIRHRQKNATQKVVIPQMAFVIQMLIDAGVIPDTTVRVVNVIVSIITRAVNIFGSIITRSVNVIGSIIHSIASVAVSGNRLYIHVGQSLLGSCYLCIDMSRRARGACTSSSVHTGGA